MNQEKNNQIIQSFASGISLLDLIIRKNRPLTFHEIQNISQFKTSNLYKYLATLVENDLLKKENNVFTLGPKFTLWQNTLSSNPKNLTEKIIERLKKFSIITCLTTLISVPTADGPLVSHIEQVDYGVNIGTQIGQHLPLESSTGLIQLAFDSRLKTALKDSLKVKLQLAKEHKFVQLDEPLIAHISSCSVPIFEKNSLICMLTFVGFSPLIPVEKNDEKITACLQIIEEIKLL